MASETFMLTTSSYERPAVAAQRSSLAASRHLASAPVRWNSYLSASRATVRMSS